jgi:hypothetical protein
VFALPIAPPPRSGSIAVSDLFADREIAGFPRGRDGLAALLAHLGQRADQTVAILTTSDSRYVSACVTETIEQRGRWSRTIEETTTIALVIHEWGFPRSGMAALGVQCRERGIVLIEDCAYAFGTYLRDASIGNHGDYALFSLPKFFAVASGGLLLAAAGQSLPPGTSLSAQVEEPAWIVARRLEMWQHYVDIFGCDEYPAAEPGVPGVFLLRCSARFERLKPYLQARGIEAGYWYGNEYLFLPCHQHMTIEDVRRVHELVLEVVNDGRLY